jgi:hypothetical protein
MHRHHPTHVSWRRIVNAALFIVPVAASTALAQGPGFPNVQQVPGTLLSGPNLRSMGRTAVIAFHQGVLFTIPEIPSSAPDSDFLVRTWDISNPRSPVVLDTWGTTPHGFQAHGYLKSGQYLIVDAAGDNTYRSIGPGRFEKIDYPGGLSARGGRSAVMQPWTSTSWWTYKEVSGNAILAKGGTQLASWDHLGLTGVIGHPFIIGNLLIYAAEQSDSGIATYDISNPASPVLLDVLKGDAIGGYFPELWRHYVVWPRRDEPKGFVVVDYSDPRDLRLVTVRDLGEGINPMYIQFQDEFAFLERFKVDMRTFETVLTLDEEAADLDTSQFTLPIGNLLISGGLGSRQGMGIWAHQAEPDRRSPTVGYHIPRAGQTGYPLRLPITLLIHETLETPTIVNGQTFIVRPVGGAPLTGTLFFSYNDILTFSPAADLLPNTTYEVVIPAGGIKDAAGNGIEPYSFRFATGSTVDGGGTPSPPPPPPPPANLPPEIAAVAASPYPVAPGRTVTVSVTADDPEGAELAYSFDWGDGSPPSAFAPAASADHAYGAVGHFQPVVQVRDAAGAVAAARTTVTVVDAPAGPSPVASSSIAVDVASRRVWTVNPDADTVTALNADTRAVLVEAPVGADPRSLALAADGTLWVACHDADRIDVLDARSGSTVARLALGYGSAPIGIVIAPGGATAYAALTGSGELARLDVASRAETGRLWLGPTPRALAMTGDGSRLLVTRYVSPESFGEVWEVDAAGFRLARAIRLLKDVAEDTLAGGRGVPNFLAGITIAPGGTQAWVVAKKDNTDRGPVADGREALDQDNTVRTVAICIDIASGAELRSRRFDIDNSDSAAAVAFSPLGDYALVALQGNNEVAVLDLLAAAQPGGSTALVTRLGTELAPQGLTLDPTTGRLFVQALTARRVSVIELADFLEGGNPNAAISSVATVSRETLASDVLRGKQLFYNARDPRMSAEGYLSCATCHADGGHDGRVWDFTGGGEGLRNTTTLQGRAGMGHGAVHWTANFDEIQDFENPIRGLFGGTGFLSSSQFAATQDPLGAPKAGLNADLDALAAYVASLDASTIPRSPHRSADGSMTAAARAGRLVFEAAACGSCHVPGLGFIDGLRHDVGTLRTSSGLRLGAPLDGIDTPTLLGIHATAPYLHDGSAAMLEEVFAVAGGVNLQVESGSLRGGARVRGTADVESYWRGGAYVRLERSGDGLVLRNVDGGAGGEALIAVRHSAAGAQRLTVMVNGAAAALDLGATGNVSGFESSRFSAPLAVVLTAGATNTIEIRADGALPSPGTAIDEVVVSPPEVLAVAEPHRRVLALSDADRGSLLAYLRQLDGSDAAAAERSRSLEIRVVGPGGQPMATTSELAPSLFTRRVTSSGWHVFEELLPQSAYSARLRASE